MYQVGSIKNMEIERLGSSEKVIIGGQLIKTSADWNNLFQEKSEQISAGDVMNEVWCSNAFAAKLVLRKLVSVVQDHCHLLESNDGVKETEIS